MKFLLTRTSQYTGINPPCKNAIKGEEIAEDEFEWYVEINSIEELNQLADEVGNIIIIPQSKSFNGKYEIEIYDSFRE